MAAGGAAGAKFYFPDQLEFHPTGGKVEIVSSPLATQLQVLRWQAEEGQTLKFRLPLETSGHTAIHLVAVHSPQGPGVRVLIDGKPLETGDGSSTVALRSGWAARVLTRKSHRSAPVMHSRV